jgi:nucleotide-binding universal stress UspA family protein
MVSIKRILCPIDFSEFSRHALARAVAIAGARDAAIVALHVVPVRTPLVVSPLEVYEPVPIGLTDAERERLQKELTAFCELFNPDGVSLQTSVVEAPTVHGEILALAGRLQSDLIVMGTHGRSGFQRLLLGSITEKVLRTAGAPVLTVGATPVPTDAGTASFARILCGVDFSECSIAALGYAMSLADEQNTHVTVVNVVETTPMGYDPLVGPLADLEGYRLAAETSGKDRLHKVVLDAAPQRPDVEEIVASGQPHHELLRIAAEQHSDLIVLGIHGRNPIERMLFGSTAEPIVRRAMCPVLTVRAGAAAHVAAA